ncbi:MAG: nitroreductase family protein [Lachnoclostridium sp.]|jgi:nitroreductase|nr:nitroreductase family protein [Lachnoclostridium sp.]
MKSNLQKVMDQRTARRKYLKTEIESSTVKSLQEYIKEINKKGQIKMELVLNDETVFKGFRKSRGMFSGVRNYITLVGKANDNLAMEKLGYYGEQVVLYATALGLGTCWVGGTFDRSSCKAALSAGESVICVISVGNVRSEKSLKEEFIHMMTHHKTKNMEQLYISDTDVPDWFMKGIMAVQKAPSAVNRQPVTFTYKKDKVTAFVEDISSQGYALDLGIAKLHFELGSGGGVWQFGNFGEYSKDR